MSNLTLPLDRLNRLHQLGRRIVERFGDPEFLSDVVCQIGQELGYTVVGLSIEVEPPMVARIWTADGGRTWEKSQSRVAFNTGDGDIVLWAMAQGVLTPDTGASLLGMTILPSPGSTLTAPLRIANQTIGLLLFESAAENAFDDRDQVIQEFLASQIAIAVDKVAQLGKERRKTEYLVLVSGLGRDISGVLAVPELCNMVTRLVREQFAYSTVAIYLRDAVKPLLTLQSFQGESNTASPMEHEIALDHGAIGWVVTNSKPFLSNEAENNTDHQLPVGHRCAKLIVPLLVGTRVIGVIDLRHYGEQGRFDDVDVLAMTALAGQVAILLDNAKLFQDLKKSMDGQVQLQEQLIQSEKLSALGQLVAGIIHEINNPLTAVIGYADLELMRDAQGASSDSLKKIAQESRRVAQIVRNLLAFARKEKPVRELVNVSVILHDIARIRAYNLRSTNIQVIENYAPDLPVTLGDPNQLRQVFLNVISNAEHAIRKSNSRGWIRITTKSFNRDGETFILVGIQDNGGGISSSHISKIFDPFFTTKKVGEGTGLGLSISYGIIKEHEGRLWVECPPNEGACFYIERPVRMDLRSENVSPQQDTPGLHTLPKRILVVDDEDEIGSYLHSALARRGHTVDTARDGQAAWGLIGLNQYDVILTDLKMPGMTGFWLYERIRTDQPSLLSTVVVMTGDVVSSEVQGFLQSSHLPYIEKPFTLSQLDKILATVNEE